jgi:hypothetical protein
VSKVKAKRLGLRSGSNPFPSIKFLRSFRFADDPGVMTVRAEIPSAGASKESLFYRKAAGAPLHEASDHFRKLSLGHAPRFQFIFATNSRIAADRFSNWAASLVLPR